MAEVVPKEELRALLLRFYRAWEAIDVDGVTEIFSRSPCLMAGGTAPEEWFHRADTVNVFATQVREMGHVIRDRIAAGYHDLLLRIRISALALGGEILASDLVQALAQSLGTFTFGDPRTTSLKGLEGSFILYPVLR